MAEAVDVWKRTMRLKLKTLWKHTIKLSRMTQDNQLFGIGALNLLHEVMARLYLHSSAVSKISV